MYIVFVPCSVSDFVATATCGCFKFIVLSLTATLRELATTLHVCACV
jgi:hypothetical protein